MIAVKVLGFLVMSLFGSGLWFFIVGFQDMGQFESKWMKVEAIVGTIVVVGLSAWLFFIEIE